MKSFFFLIIIIGFVSCNKSKKIAPNLKIKKISTYRLCGFHHVHVYDVLSEISINDKFYKYPKTKYLNNLYPGGEERMDHELLKWKKLNESDSIVVDYISFVNKECDVFQFRENMDFKDDEIYFSGVSNFKGFLILNVDRKKLYFIKYYDIGMPFS